MITEIAQIDVKPGTEKDFEAAVAKASPLFLRAKGGHGFELHKSIEKPPRYRLMVKWETLENHTVDFRGSEDFTAWRGLVGQYFAAPPEVEHTETVLTTSRLTPLRPRLRGEAASALKWSIMTFAIAISGSASARPQMPNTTPSRIWNENSVAGGNVERVTLDDRGQHIAFQRMDAHEQHECAGGGDPSGGKARQHHDQSAEHARRPSE